MKIKHIILASILFITSLHTFAADYLDGNDKNKSEEIFTSKDKDFLQLWHYEQTLKMDLNEKERGAYFSILNTYTYKMAHLGAPKFGYSDAERKNHFDALAEKLDAKMKNQLSGSNYSIHQKTFNKIKGIVYKKRNWD